MSLLAPLHLDLWIAIIEAIGSLVIAGYCAAAVCAFVRRGGVTAARLLVAQGAITGLSYKLAAALLLQHLLTGNDPYASPNLLPHLSVTAATTVTLQASVAAPVSVGFTGSIYQLVASSTASAVTTAGPGTQYIALDFSQTPPRLLPTLLTSSVVNPASQVLVGSVYYDGTSLQPSPLDLIPVQLLPSSQLALSVVRYDGGSGQQAYAPALQPCTIVPAKPFTIGTQMLAVVVSRIAGILNSTGAAQTYAVVDGLLYAESKQVGLGEFRTLGFDIVVLNPGAHTLMQQFVTPIGTPTVTWVDNHAFIFLFRIGEVI